MILYRRAGKIAEQRERINAIRDALEVEPISVTIAGLLGSETIVVDCDEKSEKRMRDTVGTWLSLGVSTMDWTLADDTEHEVNLLGLTAVLDKMVENRALRALPLHLYARTLKAQLPVPDDDPMFDSANWVY